MSPGPMTLTTFDAVILVVWAVTVACPAVLAYSQMNACGVGTGGWLASNETTSELELRQTTTVSVHAGRPSLSVTSAEAPALSPMNSVSGTLWSTIAAASRFGGEATA